MLKQSYRLLLINNLLRSQQNSISKSSALLSEKWDLLSAVCLERKPIIAPVLNDIEKEYNTHLGQLEFERSLKSDHEIRHESDLKQLELLKKGGEIDADINLKETAQDFFDACTEELNQFKFANRTTEADKKNDLKSLNRKLDKHLVLVVNQKIGSKNFYLLPQGMRQDGETLRQTADRVLAEHCGKEIKAQIYGNAPSSFYKYKYPKNIRNDKGVVGAKIFIYFARLENGQFPNKSDFRWLDRNELKKILPQEYENSVSQMLIDE